MRLNASSMSKLYDLMLMSIKLQLFKMKYPEEMIQITLNHLNSLVDILRTYGGTQSGALISTVLNEIDWIKNVFQCLKVDLFRVYSSSIYCSETDNV